MAKSDEGGAAFDWAASDERLHAACVAALARFAREHPGEAICFFALDTNPEDCTVRVALDTLVNNMRVVKRREAAAVAAREDRLRGGDAYKNVEPGFIHPLNTPVLSAFNSDREDFAHPNYAEERFPDWGNTEAWPEQDDYAGYSEPNILLVLWRVAERLVAEGAFGVLTLASPFMVGYGIDGRQVRDETEFRQNILRLLNWPADAAQRTSFEG